MWVFFILLLKPSEIHCKEFKMFDKQQPINLNMTIYETIDLNSPSSANKKEVIT